MKRSTTSSVVQHTFGTQTSGRGRANVAGTGTVTHPQILHINEIHVTQEKLKEISDTVARKGKISKDGLYSAVKRIGEEKNWFTRFIMYPKKGGAGVFK